METGKNYTHTNVSIYQAIAEEAYAEMVQFDNENKRPKEDESDGWIITCDSNNTSLKKAMIVIIFTGMWLDALLHIQIMERCGEGTFKRLGRRKYEDKLKFLGVTDIALLTNVKKFRATRNELVHEKAFLDNAQIKIAQKEARLANEIMSQLQPFFCRNKATKSIQKDARSSRS